MVKALHIAFWVWLLPLSVLFAQEPVDSIHLKEVKLVYTLKKPVQSLKKQPLDSMILAENSGSSIADILSRYTPVFIKSYGPGNLASASFRGTAANHTKLYWNDIPLNSPMLGQMDLNLLPVFLLDKVTVNFGAESLSQGSGGIGGSIALESEMNKRRGIELQQNFGSFGTIKSYAGAFYGKKKFSGSSKVYRQKADNDFPFTNFYGERVRLPNASSYQYGLMQQLAYELNSKRKLQAQLWYENSQRQIPPLMTSRSSEERQYDKSLRSNVKYEQQLSKGSLNVAGSYTKEYLNYENPLVSLYSKSNFDLGCLRLGHKWQFNKKLSSEHELQAFYEKAFTSEYAHSQHRLHGSLLSQWNWQPNSLLGMNALLRPEWYEGKTAVINWVLSTGITPCRYFALYANGGRNHDFPTLNELYWTEGGNPDLLPEKAWMTEAGIRVNPLPKKKLQLEIKGNVFSNWIENYIQWQPSGGSLWEAQNLGKVWTRGLESSLLTEYKARSHSFSLHLNYSYTKSESISPLDPSAKKPLIYVPDHTIQGRFQWDWKGWWLQLVYNYTGKRPIPGGDLAHYELWNLALGKSLSYKKLDGGIILRISNILDTEYQVMALRPMPGRNFEIGLRLNFDRKHEK